MRCPKCSAENKRTARFCSDCGATMSSTPSGNAVKPTPAAGAAPSVQEPSGPFWRPDWRWHLRALLGIYLFLVVLYFSLNLFLSRVPEPYRLRDIPKEMTPWLKR